MINVLFYQNNPCGSLQTYLKRHFSLIEATNEDILDLIAKNNYDVALIDEYSGPDTEDPYYLIRCIKDLSSKAIIVMITRDNSRTNLIKAMRVGADLYFTKPYYIDEVCVQIQSAIRNKGIQSVSGIYKIGEYSFSPKTGELACGDFYKKLSNKSKELLRILYEHKNTVVSRAELLKNVWHASDYFSGRSMDVYMCYLRKDLEMDPDIMLECLYSTGYILHCP